MRESRSRGSDEALRPADAAVRSVLIESRRDILRFLTRRLGDAREAEDVLQAFMLRALERAGDLRDLRTVRGWLGRVLTTTLIDHQRRAARRRTRETHLAPEAAEALQVEADGELDQAVCDCLYRILPTLRPAYAEIIWRADLLGEPRARIAASLGLSLNSVNVRLHRGRRALGRRLETMCDACAVHGFLDCRCERTPLPPRERGKVRRT